MDPATFLYIRLRGKTHGPLSREHLIELARGRFITPQTAASTSLEGPWIDLGAISATATLFDVLPREIETANPDDGPPLELGDIIAAANRPSPSASKPSPPAQPSSAEHDVRSLLQFNLAIEQARGLHRLKPLLRRGPSRRRRDYFIVMTLTGVLIFLVLLVESYLAVQIQVLAARMPEQFWPILQQVLFHSPIFVWGLAAFFFYAIALGWLMFFVMEDY